MKYEVRNMKNLPKGGIVIFSGESKTYDFEFTKFYDEKEEVTGLIFNAIRVLKSYSGKKELRQAEMDNAVSLYSITMEL